MKSNHAITNVMNAIAACHDDLELESCLKTKRNELPYDLWNKVLEEFSYIADFYTDSDVKFVARIAKLSKGKCLRAKFKAEILKNWTDDLGKLNLEGLELSNANGNRFAFFCKCATDSGNVRYSGFDAMGFSHHVSRPTYEEVLEEAIIAGFTSAVSGKLASLSSDPKFFSQLSH